MTVYMAAAEAAVDPERPLAELVLGHPERRALLERLQLDYCCAGTQTLAGACAERGLDAGTMSQVLQALSSRAAGGGELHDCERQGTSLAALCEHIAAVHHVRVRGELPRIGVLLSRVVHAHVAQRPALGELQHAFDALRALLEPHLQLEEDLLFPRCVALERNGMPIEEALIEAHEDEHRAIGERLTFMRQLAQGYDRSHALCETHRATLEALAAFELDLRQHIHEESNILLPRARELAAQARNAMRAG